MTDSVDDLIVKTEKLAIDSKFDANWCDLPPEIKLECIKPMDFQMRSSVRNTSHTERELVDSLRFPLQEVHVSQYYVSVRVHRYEFYSVGNTYGYACDAKKLVPSLFYVLNTCDIERFEFGNQLLLNHIQFEKIGKMFKPKIIYIKYYYDPENENFNGTLSFFKNCWNHIEKISLNGSRHTIPFEEFFKIPSVFTANNMQLYPLKNRIDGFHFYLLIEKWIENDVDVGTRVTVTSIEMKCVEQLSVKFQDRLISYGNSKLRIKTDNSEKHILMLVVCSHINYFYGVVIPSDLEESQYDKHIILF